MVDEDPKAALGLNEQASGYSLVEAKELNPFLNQIKGYTCYFDIALR